MVYMRYKIASNKSKTLFGIEKKPRKQFKNRIRKKRQNKIKMFKT